MPDGEKRYRARGRVNLIGDHTDYDEGFVLPVAIDLACTVRVRPRADHGVVGMLAERGRPAPVAT